MSAHPSHAEFVDAFGSDAMRLPDVVALGTTAADWSDVLTALNAHVWAEGHALELVLPADGISSIPLVPAPGVLVNLFPGEDVAFDFDLTEMRDQRAVDSVCQIARLIGRSTGQPVVFLPEGESTTSAVLQFNRTIDAFELIGPTR